MKKKDWWDFSYNPVKGCNGPAGDGVHCSYCYAKKMVKSFSYAETVAAAEMNYKYDDNWEFGKNKLLREYREVAGKIYRFEPHFFEYVLAQKLRKKPTMYFFSMSDPADWEQSWYERIVEKIKQYPQHTFVVLTKRPRIYKKYTFSFNVWTGVTIENQNQLDNLEKILKYYKEKNWYGHDPKFLSIEPIQEKIQISKFMKNKIDWIIVGPETGTKKKTPGEWLDSFFSLDIPVFMKNAWKKYTNRKLRQEWPEGYRE